MHIKHISFLVIVFEGRVFETFEGDLRFVRAKIGNPPVPPAYVFDSSLISVSPTFILYVCIILFVDTRNLSAWPLSRFHTLRAVGYKNSLKKRSKNNISDDSITAGWRRSGRYFVLFRAKIFLKYCFTKFFNVLPPRLQ